MSILHSKTVTIADLTGTVTVGAFPLTSTVAATDIVRPSDWIAEHIQGMTLAGNTAGVSTLTGTNIVLAGGNNVTLSGIQGAEIATISISAGADTVDMITVSAGTQSSVLGSLVFSNANDFSFGLDGSTITGSYTVPAQTAFVLSNSNNLTFGTNGSTVTASAAINISAGTTSGNLSAVTFSNSNGVSFGIDGGTITASVSTGGGNTISYFNNYIPVTNTATYDAPAAFAAMSYRIQPFVLPAPLSADFLRIPVSMGLTSTSFGTTGTTSFRAFYGSTIVAAVYSQGTGASSTLLSRIASGSVQSYLSQTYTASGNGSRFEIGQTITFPLTGGTSSFTFSQAFSSTRADLDVTQFSNFSGLRRFDIPFATSLPQSNLWLMVGGASALDSNSGLAAFNNLVVRAFPVAPVYSNSGMGVMGAATASSDWLRAGLGVVTSNATAPPATIAFSAISTVSSHLAPFFEIFRQA